MRFVRFVFTLIFPLLLTVAATHAQSVRWEMADQGSLSSTVQLVFENCAPEGQPDLPTVPGITFTFVGQSQSTNIVNFQVTRSVALTYMVRARQNTPVQIPAFTVRTDKGAIRVPAFDAGAPGASIDSVASARLIPERTSVWVGEVFGLDYELTASRRNNPQISPTFEWNAAPFVAEDWSKPEVSEAVVGGERRVNVLFRTRLSAKTPGTVRVEPASHLLSIQTGTIGFGIIAQARMEPVSVASDQPSIEVRPLPTAPAGFTGAVGQFTLTSKVIPEKAAVGEPVTWTLELSGTGNWPDLAGLPARVVSKDFQVVQPKAKRTPAEGKLFQVTLTEDVVLVPTKAGNYELGPVNFSYFDPKSGSYKTISAPRTVLAISTAAPPPFSAMTPTVVTPPSEPATKSAPPRSPPPPAAIPRDPLSGYAEVRAPMSRGALGLWLLGAGLSVIVYWGWLAVRRAKATDPVRPRREARDRIARTLALLPSATAGERTSLLLTWQRDVATLWQVATAAPRPTAFSDPQWARLWTESDRALYAGDDTLPADWVARAQEAIAAKTVPGFQPLRLFLPQNLMPFAAGVALLLAATSTLLEAAEPTPIAAYQSGGFAAAEKAWRTRLASVPTDWIARHNLSLALAQQERPAESAAQAAAAFVQHPGNASVRWHFGHSIERSGFASPTLAAFLNPGPRHALAREASAATWQLVVIFAGFTAALALGGLLWNVYGPRRAGIRWTAIGLFIVASAASAAAISSLLAYGTATSTSAVVIARAGTLRSIPTEADTAQKTSPLAPGALAVTDLSFLNGRWIRLVFENGQTGWVRKDDVVPLWK
jgi:hypothetical protein